MQTTEHSGILRTNSMQLIPQLEGRSNAQTSSSQNPEAALNKLLHRPKRGPLRFLIGPDQSPLTTFEHMNAAITAHYYTSVFDLCPATP